MTSEQLQQLISRGETLEVEFKGQGVHIAGPEEPVATQRLNFLAAVDEGVEAAGEHFCVVAAGPIGGGSGSRPQLELSRRRPGILLRQASSRRGIASKVERQVEWSPAHASIDTEFDKHIEKAAHPHPQITGTLEWSIGCANI
jgi:hypothetical protein